MSERRTIVVLPDGNRCIELQQDFVGGSETQVVVSYHEIPRTLPLRKNSSEGKRVGGID